MSEGILWAADRSVALSCHLLTYGSSATILGLSEEKRSHSRVEEHFFGAMKKTLDRLRRLLVHARMDRLIFLATVISLWSDVAAAQTSGTCECDQQCPKTRELVTTVWGGVFTLFLVSLDSWGMVTGFVNFGDAIGGQILRRFICFTTVVLNPFAVLYFLLGKAVRNHQARLRWPGFTVWSSLSPWTKSPVRIVYGCTVVITVPETIPIPSNFEDENLPSLSEALVIGRGREESVNTKNICLKGDGKEVLLGLNVLPPYDQLKVLQGNSGSATIISAVQSIGYIYGVVVRTIQRLPVSPIEVVATTLSIVILTKALHNISSTCHRPLQVYLKYDEALQFVDMCNNYKATAIILHQSAAMVAMAIILTNVLHFYTYMLPSTRIIMVLPILLTFVGIWLPLVVLLYSFWIREDLAASILVWFMCGMINVIVYVWALVVTIKYWKVDRLNAKTSSILAQILPYIG